MEITSSLGD